MLNQVVIVGRIKRIKDDHMIVAVARAEKEKNGTYKNDFIKVKLDKVIRDNALEYCHKGDIVGVKARVRTGNRLIAEKLTFLSSGHKQK